MDSIDKLFPWIVAGLGFFLFNFGLWGITGGTIMISGVCIYLYKNRKEDLKVICGVLAAILAIKFLIFLMNQMPQ